MITDKKQCLTHVPNARYNFNQRHVRNITDLQEDMTNMLEDKIQAGKTTYRDFHHCSALLRRLGAAMWT